MPCTGPTLVLVLLLSVASPVSADPLRLRTDGDIYTLYERLQPGMTVKEVTAVIGDGRLREAPDTVTAWVIWSPPMTGRATAVLRALFRDGRLLRVNYELFGEEYRRLIKGGDGDVDPAQGELRVLWSQRRQLDRHAELCHDALEAYHRLVLDRQERLTRDEQGAWARTLELRRRAERPPDLGRPR